MVSNSVWQFEVCSPSNADWLSAVTSVLLQVLTTAALLIWVVGLLVPSGPPATRSCTASVIGTRLVNPLGAMDAECPVSPVGIDPTFGWFSRSP